jgi:hypothetical protein
VSLASGRKRERGAGTRRGFEVKPTTAGRSPAVLKRKKTVTMAETVYDRINDYGSVKIQLASPNDIRSWSSAR